MFWGILLLLLPRRLPQGELFKKKMVVRRGGVYLRVGIMCFLIFFIWVGMDKGTSMKERSSCKRSLFTRRFVQSWVEGRFAILRQARKYLDVCLFLLVAIFLLNVGASGRRGKSLFFASWTTL